MSRRMKVALVVAGYLLAPVAGGVASHLYNVRVAGLPEDTSGGMYAAGEAMSWLAAVLVVALIPTLLALWFLRRNVRLWQSIAFASLGFASAGLIAVILWFVSRGTPGHPLMVMVDLFGLAQLLGVPLWTGAFVLFALLAPTRRARRLLVAAVGIELVIGVCAAIHWLAPSSAL